MKDDKTAIEEFNNMVNMTAGELKSWLKTSDSCSVGWSKDEGSRESVGHESGRKIIGILESNPTKESSKYSDEQLQHMRKVVSYCKRHLAEEERINDSKSSEEVKKTKSYASLKNWGHDPLKKRNLSHHESDGEDNAESGYRKQSGKRRKVQIGAFEGHDKRRKTKEKASNSNQKNLGSDSNISSVSYSAHSDENSPDPKSEDKELRGTKAASSDISQNRSGSRKGPDVGEEVSWNWGRGQPKGKVLDVKNDKKTITTKRGNKVSRKGDTKDPAVTIDTGKSTAIKLAHELNS